MRKSCFTAAQIIGMIKQLKARQPRAEAKLPHEADTLYYMSDCFFFVITDAEERPVRRLHDTPVPNILEMLNPLVRDDLRTDLDAPAG